MSIAAKAAMNVLWFINKTGMMDMTIENPEEELEKARLWNAKHKFIMPKDHKAYYKEINVLALQEEYDREICLDFIACIPNISGKLSMWRHGNGL